MPWSTERMVNADSGSSDLDDSIWDGLSIGPAKVGRPGRSSPSEGAETRVFKSHFETFRHGAQVAKDVAWWVTLI